MKKRVIALMVALCACASCDYKNILNTIAELAGYSAQREAPAPAEMPQPSKCSIAFVGDICLGRGVDDILIANNSFSNVFADVRPVLDKADFAVGNLECVISDYGRRREPDKGYYLRADPRAVESLIAGGFDAVSLANNHTGDYRNEGLVNMMSNLQAHYIRYFGAGHYYHEAHLPAIFEKNGVRVAVLGYDGVEPQDFEATYTSPGCAWLNDTAVKEDIAVARTLADFVVIMPHYGKEEYFEIEPRVAQEYRNFIRWGADAVMGCHPHILQGYERIAAPNSRVSAGGLIVYSMGNFIFDMNRPLNKQTAIFTLTFEIQTNGAKTLDMEIVPATYNPATAEVHIAPPLQAEYILNRIESYRRYIP